MNIKVKTQKRDIDSDITVLSEGLRPHLKLLTVCLSHSWGGLEQVTAHDSVDFAKLGLSVSFLCINDSPVHEYLKNIPEVRVLPITYRPRNYFDLKLRLEFQRLIKGGINIIHTHQTTLLGSITPWIWRFPHVGLFASRHIMNRHNKRNFYHHLIYRRLDGLIVVSQTLRKNILLTHAISPNQVKVVNLGLDFKRFDFEDPDIHARAMLQREQWGADPETIVIGMVGRIDPAKGQDTFIKAAAGLIQRCGQQQKIKFVIIGERTQTEKPSKVDEAYFEELQSIIKQFNLESNIVFSGYKENIPEIMRAFDVFVMPSLQETFGLVAIEAMAMERPVVISRGGSSDEIVGRREYGLKVRPNDAFDLQLQLRYLLEDAEKRIEMGKRARQHVYNNYDRRLRISKTLKLYDRALTQRGSH